MLTEVFTISGTILFNIFVYLYRHPLYQVFSTGQTACPISGAICSIPAGMQFKWASVACLRKFKWPKLGLCAYRPAWIFIYLAVALTLSACLSLGSLRQSMSGGLSPGSGQLPWPFIDDLWTQKTRILMMVSQSHGQKQAHKKQLIINIFLQLTPS